MTPPLLLLPTAMRDELLRYFYTRPYGEVAPAVHALERLAPAPEAKDPEQSVGAAQHASGGPTP